MTQTATTALQATAADPKLLTLSEAADQLRISVDTLLRFANLGEIPTVRIGRRRLIAPADLDAFIDRQREEYDRDAW